MFPQEHSERDRVLSGGIALFLPEHLTSSCLSGSIIREMFPLEHFKFHAGILSRRVRKDATAHVDMLFPIKHREISITCPTLTQGIGEIRKVLPIIFVGYSHFYKSGSCGVGVRQTDLDLMFPPEHSPK